MSKKDLINILSTLHAYKVIVKQHHWAMTSSLDKHKQLDELYDILDKFQDSFAEDGMMIFGVLKWNDYVAMNIAVDDPEDLVDQIADYAVQIKTLLCKKDFPDYAGLHGITDTFVHETKVLKYRFMMK